MGTLKTILIIDSSKNYSSRLKKELEDTLNGVTVLLCINDISIRQKLHENLVDLIIADIHSLSVSARTFLATVQDEFPATSVFFTSSSYQLNIALELIDQGAADYIDRNCTECIAARSYQFLRSYRSASHSISNELTEVVDLIQKSNIGELYIADLNNFQFIYANKTLMDNLGYTDQTFKDLYLDDIIENLKSGNLKNRLALHAEDEHSEIITLSLNHIRKDGSKYPVTTHFKIYHQLHKQYLIGLSINDSQQHEDASELQKLRAHNKYKSEFIANISHEMRTTLNSILILSETLGERNSENLTEKQKEKAQVIHKATDNLLQLLNQVLDLSKIDSRKIDLSYSTINIRDGIEQLIKLHQPIAHTKNIELSYSVSDSVPDTFITDSIRLQQILNNLVSNAIKFTENGGVTVSIQIENRSAHPTIKTTERSVITFCIQDTGIGIPKNKRSLIFESYMQADGANTQSKFGGTGLGLTISKELAQLLGGDIYLDSEVGKGSSFTLTLPLTTEYPTKTKKEYPQTREPLPQINEPKPVNEISVLLVDDNSTHNLALNEFLKFHVKECISVESAAEAYQLLEEKAVDIIILDMYLPDSDGHQVLEHLQQQHHLKDIPVIIYTGKNLSNAEATIIRQKAAAVVEKNVNSYRILVQTLSSIFK